MGGIVSFDRLQTGDVTQEGRSREATQHEQLRLAIRNAGSRLVSHQPVTGFTVWTEGDFPRTNLLKVKRHEVLATLSAGAVPRLQPPGQGTPRLDHSDLLQRLLADISGASPAVITPASDLELDLGIDSLARVELAVSLEDDTIVFSYNDQLEWSRKVPAVEGGKHEVYVGFGSNGDPFKPAPIGIKDVYLQRE